MLPRLAGGVSRLATLAGIFVVGWTGYTRLFASFDAPAPTFFLREVPDSVSGLGAAGSDILNRVHPGIADIAKWTAVVDSSNFERI